MTRDPYYREPRDGMPDTRSPSLPPVRPASPAEPVTQEQKDQGEVCSRCGVEFDGRHGRPVLCWSCHGLAEFGGQYRLSKAWLEEKPR